MEVVTFSNVSLLGVSPVLVSSCSARRHAQAPVAEPGQTHFQSYCAACHQYDGQGMGGAPPLDRSPWVTGPQDRLIKIVLHGVRGPMEVAGRTYDLEMPGFAPVLSDEDLAALLSFGRNRYGRPSSPVTPEAVSRVRTAHRDRTEYWTVDELLGER
jgi:mono/diheme cytochrome c family protein